MPTRLPGGRFYGELTRHLAVAGLHLTETRYAPGTRLPRHCHEHAYFCLVRRGTYREEYAGNERLCGPHTLAFHPAEEDHAEEFGRSEVRSFNIEIAPGWLGRAGAALPLRQALDCRGGAALGLALRLLHEFDRPDDATPLIVEGLALELLGLCARATQALKENGAPRWLRRARDLLTERSSDPPTLAELACEAGVHPGYLASAFRRFFGCTAGEHVRRQRVARACRELTGPDATLAQIALRAGFADQSHFTRTFKRLLGVTPAAFRALAAGAAGRSKT
jgi:AraC family transcriptional regulator